MSKSKGVLPKIVNAFKGSASSDKEEPALSAKQEKKVEKEIVKSEKGSAIEQLRARLREKQASAKSAKQPLQ